jgi:hypothetical protein
MIRLPLKVSPQNLRICGLIAVLICVLLFFATQIHNYLNKDLFIRVSTSVAIMALIAIGQTLVILTRNIDLSVGSVVGRHVEWFTGRLCQCALHHRDSWHHGAVSVLAGPVFGCKVYLNRLIASMAGLASTDERDQRWWLRRPRDLRDYLCRYATGAFCLNPAARGTAFLCCRLKSGRRSLCWHQR